MAALVSLISGIATLRQMPSKELSRNFHAYNHRSHKPGTIEVEMIYPSIPVEHLPVLYES